jgi:hypothetical protein
MFRLIEHVIYLPSVSYTTVNVYQTNVSVPLSISRQLTGNSCINRGNLTAEYFDMTYFLSFGTK